MNLKDSATFLIQDIFTPNQGLNRGLSDPETDDKPLCLPNFDFHSINFSDYSTIEDYSILDALFFKIHKEVYDEPDFSHGTSFLDAYVSNLSKKDEESYTKTQHILLSIQEKLIKENSDSRMFNINLLIDNSKNNYINSKSVPLTFKEALIKVESILQ